MATDVIPAQLPDLRGILLADLAELNPEAAGEAVKRVLPDFAPVPVAAFQSAI